ncbi:putative odorant receptor 85d isoform X2 [Harpegnathos saltator]|uniref:putative odorant receptor 85d isoform X2 n=1 Tax=Harpegnathos saltator TaxID=610380 RepID=UPI0009491CDD|nr:putative odorant receptor 85d isoform X2 [Harpegnathos saltator]
MHVLEFTLSILTVAGAWRPLSCTSLVKNVIYNAYTILLSTAVFMFTTTQFMYLIFNANNADEVTETLYVALLGLIGNFKIITINLNHQSFAAMLDNLSEKPFKPMEQNETIIRAKFDKMIKTNAIVYLTLIVLTDIYMTSTSLLMDFRRRDLTFKAWFPFDYSVSVIYYFLYIHQMISVTLCGFLNVASDCFFSGLLLHICCQIEILEYRLSRIANNQAKLRECVLHHYRIFDQFIGACLVVCCLLLRLTISTSSFMYIETVMCTGCALIAIFYYCWFGNEVRLKSIQLSENIYKMEWPDFNNDVKKCFLIIMNRATSLPIKFTSAHIVPLNLESFVVVLKTSYSVFNLMRPTQEEK